MKSKRCPLKVKITTLYKKDVHVFYDFDFRQRQYAALLSVKNNVYFPKYSMNLRWNIDSMQINITLT